MYSNNCEKINNEDLCCITKISTPLFIFFNIITFGIYYWVKIYRITNDIRKIVPRDETVSPLIITTSIIISLINLLEYTLLEPIVSICFVGFVLTRPIVYLIFVSIWILGKIIGIIVYCHIVFRTLNNIRKIAKIKQNKKLRYNKFWAFIFGFVYTNFVLNTYEQRLFEIE